MNEGWQKRKSTTGPLLIANIFMIILIVLAVFSIFWLMKRGSVAKIAPAGEKDFSKAEESDYLVADGSITESENEENSMEGFTVNNRSFNFIGANGEVNETPTANSDYILAESSGRLINDQDVMRAIDSYSNTFIDFSNVPQMIINEILARHGYLFKNDKILAYFRSKDWYPKQDNELEPDMDKVMGRLNETERKNIDFIVNNYR